MKKNETPEQQKARLDAEIQRDIEANLRKRKAACVRRTKPNLDEVKQLPSSDHNSGHFYGYGR